MTKPLLIYDDDCSFCKKQIKRFAKITGDRVDYAASQEVGSQFPQISSEQFQESVWLIEEGRVSSAAEAVFRALAMQSSFWKLMLWKYNHIPGFSNISEWMYQLVAKHRSSNCKT
jgi:predicted DCC family thiol-disulfide oxidoreductase YuxK